MIVFVLSIYFVIMVSIFILSRASLVVVILDVGFVITHWLIFSGTSLIFLILYVSSIIRIPTFELASTVLWAVACLIFSTQFRTHFFRYNIDITLCICMTLAVNVALSNTTPRYF